MTPTRMCLADPALYTDCREDPGWDCTGIHAKANSCVPLTHSQRILDFVEHLVYSQRDEVVDLLQAHIKLLQTQPDARVPQ